jgi:hypothetical protein
MTLAVVERVTRAVKEAGISQRLGFGDHGSLANGSICASAVGLPVSVREHMVRDVTQVTLVSVGGWLVTSRVVAEEVSQLLID